MHRILFVCHGNICRSTMAQFVFEELVRRAGREGEFVVDSAATSREELGNPPHHGTVSKLREQGIPVGRHRARQITRSEYADWDLIVYMDGENERSLDGLFAGDPDGTCVALLSFVADDSPLHPPARTRGGEVRDVADPWYTGDFDATYRDVLAGCEGLLASL